MNQELPDVQDGFRKGRGTMNEIANINWIIEKAREFQKNLYLCFIVAGVGDGQGSLACCSPWGHKESSLSD